jgi:hypothetical protein
MMFCRRAFVVVIFVAAWTARFAAAGEVKDATLRLSITIPDGFEPEPSITTLRPEIPLAFRQAREGEDIGRFVMIERLRGTLGRERLDQSQLPSTFHGRMFRMQWKEFEVEAFEVFESAEALESVTYNVQVPLAPNAVQIKVLGLRKDAAELEALTRSLVASVDGDTNWISSVFPESVSGTEWYRWALIAIFALLFAVGLAMVVRLTRRRSRRAALLLCFVFFVIGSGFTGVADAGFRTREVVGLSGALRLLGFAGLVATFVVKKRKRAAERGSTNLAVADGPAKDGEVL